MRPTYKKPIEVFPNECPIHNAELILRNKRTNIIDRAIKNTEANDDIMSDALSDEFRTNNFHLVSK